ncbi:MAG: type II CAAX endopeptidase family protein [Mobilitalea sp.]
MYIIGTVLLFTIIGKFFPFHSPDYQFKNVKKSAIYSLLIISAEIVMILTYILVLDHFNKQIPAYGVFLLQSFFYVLLTTIVILVVLYEKMGLQSLGITKSNLVKSTLLGILLGVIFFAVYQRFITTKDAVSIFTIASLVSFIGYIFVGFAEEIIFRGYFQIRLIAWLGTTKGCLITAIIFSFYHLPVSIFFKGMDFPSAFISCLTSIPLSLMFGYIMIKTKNITAGAILHTIIDWTIN